MIHHRRPDGYYVWLACQYVELPLPAPYQEEHDAQQAIEGRSNAAMLRELMHCFRAQRSGEREYGLPQYWTLIRYIDGRHAGFRVIDIPPHVIDALDAREWDALPSQPTQEKHHETAQPQAEGVPLPLLPGEEGGGPATAGRDQSGG